MNKLTRLVMVVTVLAVAALPAFGDTLVLKNGTKVKGYFEGGSSRVVKFREPEGTAKDYDILQVQEIIFDAADIPAPTPETTAAPTPAPTPVAAAAPAPATDSGPRLRPASERPPAQPPSASAANTG